MQPYKEEKSSSEQLFLSLSCDSIKSVTAWLKPLVCALGLAAPWVRIMSLQDSAVAEVWAPLQDSSISWQYEGAATAGHVRPGALRWVWWGHSSAFSWFSAIFNGH